jgi:hypothetical protein
MTFMEYQVVAAEDIWEGLAICLIIVVDIIS